MLFWIVIGEATQDAKREMTAAGMEAKVRPTLRPRTFAVEDERDDAADDDAANCQP